MSEPRCESGTCVGVAIGNTGVVVWDTKDSGAAILTFSREEWADFLDRVKSGEYDL